MGYRALRAECTRGAASRFARPTRKPTVRALARAPSSPNPPPREPKVSILDKSIDVLNTKTAPLVASVGLLVLGVAFAQTVQRLLKLKRENDADAATSRGLSISSKSSSMATDVTSDQPILFSELEAKMMSPLLLAAETSAEVDETSMMSIAELEDLEVTLRTLLSGMDAQLEELKYDVLEQGVIPEHVLEAMDAMYTMDTGSMADGSNDVGAGYTNESSDMDGAWREFQLFQGYISDQERRSFRSLLYNRSVQLKLLYQVGRQLEIKMRVESAHDDNGGGGRMLGESVGPNALDRGVEAGATTAVAEVEERGQLLYAAGATAPHALKKRKGGDDAFFVNPVAMVMGIADGVGGWERLGVDPGAYSRELMANCESIGASGNASCMQILHKGFQMTVVEGSCTCILAKYLAMEGRLDVVCVGDCSMRVVREGQVIFKTDVQEHAWNQPFQLSHPQFNEADTPDDALDFSFRVMPGDIVVLGSDGLWDNMWDEDLLEAVDATNAMRQSYDGDVQWQNVAQELAQRLLELGEAHSLDEAYASPFAEERNALRRRSESFLTRLMNSMGPAASTAALGGKQDDISVVCAIIG